MKRRTSLLSVLVVAAVSAATVVAMAPPASATFVPDQLVLPVTYRDFLYNGTTTPGLGSPDFQNQVAGLETGLVSATLGDDHEPVWHSNGGSLSGATNFCWWFHDTGCNGPGSANPYAQDVPLDQGGNPTTLTLAETGGPDSGVYQYSSVNYFPIDGLGWNAGPNPQTSLGCTDSTQHNFAFTQEIHTSFRYSAASSRTISLTAADDVWVFINNHLVIDLGGVHSPATGSVTVDPTEASTIGLTDQQTYPVDIFYAQRHTCGSSFTLTTTMQLAQPPQVTLNGPTDGATYATGQVPAASCDVESNIDPSASATPVLSTPSNGDGTGTQTATCSYTDSAGETASDSVTYTIVASTAQVIQFTSTPPTHAVSGTPYTVTATGGPSGNPVVFITDPTSVGCSVDASGVVIFYSSGLCKIDAGQAAGGGFSAAKSVQQRIRVYLIPQTVQFTSTPPSHALPGSPYAATATGGGSGNPVTFSAAPATVCSSTSDGVLTFVAKGRCTVTATQAANSVYAKGAAHQLVVVYAR